METINIFELKNENKEIATIIRNTKNAIKTLQKEGKYAGILQSGIHTTKLNYRLNHIAYCLLRGKSYEQIEKPRKENILKTENWKKIEEIKEIYKCKCTSCTEDLPHWIAMSDNDAKGIRENE